VMSPHNIYPGASQTKKIDLKISSLGWINWWHPNWLHPRLRHRVPLAINASALAVALATPKRHPKMGTFGATVSNQLSQPAFETNVTNCASSRTLRAAVEHMCQAAVAIQQPLAHVKCLADEALASSHTAFATSHSILAPRSGEKSKRKGAQ
ncbi:hypothetical protein, partial [Bosea sp. (in: a-proteobacteria)]|uniref:hypothetical protein n=1 Tax=Bosea sp. (in: a-proteobacteria) TaxID=1871050 RepID=UPI004034B6F4